MYKLVIVKQAKKDAKKLASSKLKGKAEEIFATIKKDPFATYPPYEKLLGEEPPVYSRRINKQHRIVYEVYEKEKLIKILRMWTHYE